MIDVNIVEIKNFDNKLIARVKELENKNLGSEASINEWIIPVIIRYGKLAVVQKADDGEIIGVWELIKNWDDNQSAFVHSFYIDREFREQGVGKIFLSKIISMLKAENLKTIELTVDPENEAALKLYKEYGFTVIDLRKDEYGSGVDRCLMRLKL